MRKYRNAVRPTPTALTITFTMGFGMKTPTTCTAQVTRLKNAMMMTNVLAARMMHKPSVR